MPSTHASFSAGIYTPSSESGSPEQSTYSTSMPRRSASEPMARMKPDLPVPGPPLIMCRNPLRGGKPPYNE